MRPARETLRAEHAGAVPGYREIQLSILTRTRTSAAPATARAHLDRLIRMGEVEAERWVKGSIAEDEAP